MKRLGIGLWLCAMALMARAELPVTVLEACLAPKVSERASATNWQVMTRATWETQPVEIQESATGTTMTVAGAEHPGGWMTSQVQLMTPPLTEQQPMPTQTFTVAVTSKGIIPTMTVDIVFLQDATLPPYEIRAWGDRMAIVATAGDWYIIANDKTATLTQTKDDVKAVTLVVPNLTVQRLKTVKASILVGEGPLPPPPGN